MNPTPIFQGGLVPETELVLMMTSKSRPAPPRTGCCGCHTSVSGVLFGGFLWFGATVKVQSHPGPAFRLL